MLKHRHLVIFRVEERPPSRVAKYHAVTFFFSKHLKFAIFKTNQIVKEKKLQL